MAPSAFARSVSKEVSFFEDEFVMQQRAVNENKLKELERIEEAYWSMRSERMWEIIAVGIDADRALEESKRKKEEVEKQKKAEEERIKKEEKEKKKSEEETQRKIEEMRRNEEQEGKAQNEHPERGRAELPDQVKKSQNQISDAAKREQERLARQQQNIETAGPAESDDDFEEVKVVSGRTIVDDAPLPPEPDLNERMPSPPPGLALGKKEASKIEPDTIKVKFNPTPVPQPNTELVYVDEVKAERDYYSKLIAVSSTLIYCYKVLVVLMRI